MLYRFSISVVLVLFAYADLPHLASHRLVEPASPYSFPASERIRVLPIIVSGEPQAQSGGAPAPKSGPLQETSKLELIRFVSGEFAKARKPLPGGKEGFILYVDKPVDETLLERAVVNHGAAVNTGDNVQVTKLDFRDRTILVDVNGGGRPKKRWRDHISIGMGSPYPIGQPPTTSTTQDPGPPGLQPGMGGTLILQFPKAIPDMTPDQLKQLLSPFLDFSKERSASVHWVDTLPLEKKKAITERHAILGMDKDEVVAAMGKPDRKIRERDANGYETEDWIYGHPPDKTIFVKFTGERVTSIKQYPQ
jgi:sulfur carrier protein ThiS